MRCTSLCLLVTITLLALPGCAPNLSPVTTVLKPVERELTGTEAQTHQIELPASKYFRIEVTQLGIDASVEVRDPEGQSIATVNTPTARVGKESFLLQTTNAGAYQVLVRSNEHARKQGRYRLTVEELNNETRDDKRRLKAEQAVTEAARLHSKIAESGGSEAIEKLRADAIVQYEIAQSEWDRLRDTEKKAWTLYYMATQYYQLFEWQQAAKFAEKASALFRKFDDKLVVANALRLQGEALTDTQEKADFTRALELLNEALTIQQMQGNRYDQALTTNILGKGFYLQSQLVEARKQFVKASDIFIALNEPRQAIQLLNNIATTDQMLRNYPNAVETYNKALELSVAGDFRLERAFLLANLATANGFLGELQEALLGYGEAAELYDSLGNRLGKARALSGTGITYSRLGNWQAALNFFEQALELQGSVEESALVTTYTKIGNALRNLQQPKEALSAHKKALTLAKLPAEKATSHIELGRDYSLKGEYSSAINHFNQALEFATGEEAALARAFALEERGRLKIQQETNITQGLADLREALKSHQALHSDVGEAQTLQTLARGEHKLGRAEKALTYAEKALEITEALRNRVGSPDLRVSFTGLKLPSYELHIALLMELASSRREASEQAPDYATLALEVSERARARSLVELLTEARTDDTQGIDPKLLQVRDKKRQELAGLAHRLETLAAGGSSETATVQTTLQSVQADLDVIEARIHKQNRQYAELIQPQLLAAEGIQGLLTPADAEDTDTVLLEYTLGEEQSFLWCVTTNSIESWSLPGRNEIEAAARDVYDKLKTLDLDSASRRAAQRARDRLAEMILAPAANRLNGKRVAVVPDGALQYIPFGALPISGSGNSSVALLEQHEVVTLPSASTLAALRKAKQKLEPAKKSIAIFADPVFTRQDNRLAGNPKIQRHASTRSAKEPERNLFRLPASGREADGIASLAGPESVFKATGFAANRSKVLDSRLADYRHVHFATHGLINTQYPELSSLALSAFDENGQPRPGFLRLHDIYSLKLNADLVVLSACEAALGKDIRGEGLIGLTRGFMYAGTPSVVASLWRASDEATATLMQEFYRLMLKQGLRPADALRKAQLGISRQRKWRDPYYWAGFILQGDWR